MKHGKHLYTWDAGAETHGGMAQALGLGKAKTDREAVNHWNKETLTGFVAPSDMDAIGKSRKTFRHWVAQRHLEAKHKLAKAGEKPHPIADFGWGRSSGSLFRRRIDGKDLAKHGRYIGEDA